MSKGEVHGATEMFNRDLTLLGGVGWRVPGKAFPRKWAWGLTASGGGVISSTFCQDTLPKYRVLLRPAKADWSSKSSYGSLLDFFLYPLTQPSSYPIIHPSIHLLNILYDSNLTLRESMGPQRENIEKEDKSCKSPKQPQHLRVWLRRTYNQEVEERPERQEENQESRLFWRSFVNSSKWGWDIKHLLLCKFGPN